jgi:hypothetical protein
MHERLLTNIWPNRCRLINNRAGVNDAKTPVASWIFFCRRKTDLRIPQNVSAYNFYIYSKCIYLVMLHNTEQALDCIIKMMSSLKQIRNRIAINKQHLVLLRMRGQFHQVGTTKETDRQTC